MHTEKFGSSVIEIGANWIHGGCVANPVFNLANRRRKSLLLHDGKVHFILQNLSGGEKSARETEILCLGAQDDATERLLLHAGGPLH